jgi:hypothetical protein
MASNDLIQSNDTDDLVRSKHTGAMIAGYQVDI